MKSPKWINIPTYLNVLEKDLNFKSIPLNLTWNYNATEPAEWSNMFFNTLLKVPDPIENMESKTRLNFSRHKQK
jgi:hypothetical protein